MVLGRRVHRYIDRAQLIDVLALLASIEARDETSALVDRIEARHETRCEEATPTSLHSKKKEACKIELRRSTMYASRRH